MIGHWTRTGSGVRASIRDACLAALAGVLLIAVSASAQEAVPPPLPPAAPAPDPAPDPNYRPGFLDALGRWFGASKATIDEHLKNTHEAAKDAAGAAGQATGAIVALPGTRIVPGRERCVIAPNGAPDCAPAAASLCRSKGFGAGRSLEVSSAQRCPVSVYLSGRTGSETECRTETFVIRAICQ